MHPLFLLTARAPWLLAICVVVLSAQPARAGLKFSQVIVFGDSLSDTGNFADTTQNDYGFRYPGNAFNYADGRFTDDAGTSPAAMKYQGVWLEQLARLYLGLAPATASLEVGTDYAFGDAETFDGERTVAIGSNASIQIDNMGQQVTNYLNAHATDPAALYLVWGGANDLFADDSAANVTATAQRETALVRRLAEAGAKTILVPNLPPLGQTPAYAGSASQAAAQPSERELPHPTQRRPGCTGDHPHGREADRDNLPDRPLHPVQQSERRRGSGLRVHERDQQRAGQQRGGRQLPVLGRHPPDDGRPLPDRRRVLHAAFRRAGDRAHGRAWFCLRWQA